jgi:hypothetical protein
MSEVRKENKMNEIVYDIESDGFIFESTKIWTIVLKHKQTGQSLRVNPFKDMYAKKKVIDFIFSFGECPTIAGHFILGFDNFVIRNLLGINSTVGPDTIEGKPVKWVDTFYLSMYLNPDRAGHSIEWFGDKLGLEKINWREKAIELGLIEHSSPKGAEFMQWHPEMDVYCARDVDVNILVLDGLKKEWESIYGTSFTHTQAFKCGQKSFYLMSCQELAGWKFDQEEAKKLAVRIDGMMEEIRAEVEPKLPPRALKKTEEKDYTMPSKPFKKDGSFSSTWEKFVAKHGGKEVGEEWEFYGKLYKPESGKQLDIELPMEMANQDQMKDWFLEQGWKPTLWNYKKGPDGKPMRDPKTRELIKSSPKIQEQGKICKNLLAMETGIVGDVVKWLSLRNRRSVLQGWLDNPRLRMDGRIGASRTGIAATHRQKHSVVVNVPKASEKVLLGHEFRSLWTSEDGFLIAAADAAALEGRVQGHYTWKYDGGATARDLLEGDIHSKTAKSVYEDELAHIDITAPNFNKDDPFFKPFRDRSKNVFYAGLYGAGDAKIAATAGLPEHRGKEISEKFWAANPATKQLKDNLEKYWKQVGKEKYLPAIDGRMLCTRKKSALLNTIFQSCGGIAMDYALCFMDHWLGEIHWEDRKPYYLYKGHKVRRIGYMHDEAEFEAEEPIAEEIGDMIVKAIAKAGEFLKIKVPLAGEAKIGHNWKETH